MSDDPIMKNLMQQRAQKQANRLSQRLQSIAKHIDRDLKGIMLPGDEPPVFGLFVFTSGAAQYVGTGKREDIKQVVASILARWDDPQYPTLHMPLHEKTEAQIAKENEDPV